MLRIHDHVYIMRGNYMSNKYPKVIYKYTKTIELLEEILGSKTIWLTNIKKSNDLKEIHKNIIEDNYTCRNYIKSCRTSHNDIVVKRKKNDS